MSKAKCQLLDYSQKHKDNKQLLTTSHGQPVGDKLNTLTAGKQGPILLQDVTLLDELAHFDRETIPERVVHAKGAGAFGYFEVTKDITKYTKAIVFDKVGRKTNIAARFSRVSGEKGSNDTARDVKGFAIKFYTDDGIWDLVGNNSPLFFIRDPILFPSLMRSQKRNPVTNLRDDNMYWDFLTLRPESVHQTSFLFSDRGIPDGYRHMDGFGANTYKFVNSEGVQTYVKFIYKTNQGIKNLTSSLAEKIASETLDYYSEDLYNAIETKNYPSWTLFIQTMSVEQSENVSFDPFDVTKIWPHADFPLIEVGKIVLNRNPINFFAEIEQLAFSPSNMIPGIEPSPDKILQSRLFSYLDTQRYRLSTNFHQIPVNSAFNVCNYQRNGIHCVNYDLEGAPNYYPNSFGGPVHNKKYVESEIKAGTPMRYDTSDNDNYTQARVFWKKVLDEEARNRLVENISMGLVKAADFIQERAIQNFSKVDEEYGKKLRAALDKQKSIMFNQVGQKNP